MRSEKSQLKQNLNEILLREEPDASCRYKRLLWESMARPA